MRKFEFKDKGKARKEIVNKAIEEVSMDYIKEFFRRVKTHRLKPDTKLHHCQFWKIYSLYKNRRLQQCRGRLAANGSHEKLVPKICANSFLKRVDVPDGRSTKGVASY